MMVIDGVSPLFAEALAKQGYTTLTDVQRAVLEGDVGEADLLVSAQTGSGKTVAFGLAMASTLLRGEERFPAGSEPLAVVVAPTRELALQVRLELEWLYAPAGARIASCVGGMDMRQERRSLAGGAHIVVGTPGRLRDHITRGSLDMAAVRAMVLDEADEMLDLGFREDLEFILKAAPPERRTLMFSATVAKPIETLARRFQKNAIRISSNSGATQHANIDYRAVAVASGERENAVINILRYFEASSAFVFCTTREGVKHLASRLGNRGFGVVALSGELSQTERTRGLQAMRDGRAQVCVATDVASRGIDLPTLDLVIHADLPKDSEALLHRSGRTGRAGRSGVSVLITPHSKRRSVDKLLQAAKVKVSWMPVPSAETIIQRDRERLMNDPSLEGPLTDEEADFARDLLATKSPEQIAAAFFRQNQTRRPTPEEFVNSGRDASEVEAPRGDFEGGVWFRVSVGRKQRAEPRWILPLICKAGDVTSRDIGAIQILEGESMFEVSARAAPDFTRALMRTGKRDDTITIVPMNGRPEPRANYGDSPRSGAMKRSRKTTSGRSRKAPQASAGSRKA
ncbi:DEAD/DEAH box helicase [Rhodomicrobium lacus]|uniref:DEAD/DEAH box helicase n=1 Tax=Rhodomicrobium lacus TaxID=2498452 RepID=UPI0026E330A3|nr:DEAD/DEAH box helicase [Rhodomicrobium lacus]WKW50124.1 DEAD/DEAH box helicase [Rhodomicrobium lacus]